MAISLRAEEVPVVILAGGRGTRLGSLTANRPKSLVPVLGVPFLQYQLEWLAEHGLQDVVLCVGHLAGQIERFAGDGSAFGVRIRYAHEGKRLLGTADALGGKLMGPVALTRYA